MKLSEHQIDHIEKRTSLLAVKRENSAFEKLIETFGEHTFFMNTDGLFIFARDREDAATAQLFAYAMWDEEDENKLLQLVNPLDAGLVLDLSKPELHKTLNAAVTLH